MKNSVKKLLCFAFLSVCIGIIALLNVGAYIDPSVVSYTVQAVAGIAIAAGAVFVVWWRRFRKKVSKKLGIDENAGKEVEEDIILQDESAESNDNTDDNNDNNDNN